MCCKWINMVSILCLNYLSFFFSFVFVNFGRYMREGRQEINRIKFPNHTSTLTTATPTILSGRTESERPQPLKREGLHQPPSPECMHALQSRYSYKLL